MDLLNLVAYNLDTLNDPWNDVYTEGYIRKKHKCCNKDCNCHKDKDKEEQERKKELARLRNQLIKEMTKLINEKEIDVDMDAIIKAVDKHQLPHEDKQTSHITNNTNNIDDIKNITIWDKNFDG